MIHTAIKLADGQFAVTGTAKQYPTLIEAMREAGKLNTEQLNAQQRPMSARKAARLDAQRERREATGR